MKLLKKLRNDTEVSALFRASRALSPLRHVECALSGNPDDSQEVIARSEEILRDLGCEPATAEQLDDKALGILCGVINSDSVESGNSLLTDFSVSHAQIHLGVSDTSRWLP